MNRHVKTAQKALSEIHLCLQKLCAEFFFSLKVIEYLEVQCHDHATGCIGVLSAVNALRNLLITRLFACLKISFSLFGKSLFLVNGDNRNVCHLRKRKSVVYSSYR